MNDEVPENKVVSGETREKSIKYLGIGEEKKRLDAVILKSDVTSLLDVLRLNLYETNESEYVYLQYVHSNTTVFLYCDDKEEKRRFLRGVYGVKDKAILKNADGNSDKRIVQVQLIVKQRLPDLYWHDISDIVTLYTPNQFYSEITKTQLRALVLKMLEKNKLKSQQVPATSSGTTAASATEPGSSASHVHLDSHLMPYSNLKSGISNKITSAELPEKNNINSNNNNNNSDSPENQKYWQMPPNWVQNPGMFNQMAMGYWQPGYYKPKALKKNKVMQSKEIQTEPDERINKYEHQIVLLTEKISNLEADLELKDRRVQVAERRLEELENKTKRYENDNMVLKEENNKMKEELTRVRLALFTRLHAIGNAGNKENNVSNQKEKKRDNANFNSKSISSNVNAMTNGNIAMPVNDTYENVTSNYNPGHLSKPQSPIPTTTNQNNNTNNTTNLQNNQYLASSNQYILEQHGDPHHIYNTNIKSSDVQPPNYPPGLSSAFQTPPVSNLDIQARQTNPGCDLNASYSSNNNSPALVQDDYSTARSNLLPHINTNQPSNGLMSNQDLSPLAYNNNASNTAYTKHSNSPTPIISRTQDTVLPDLTSSQDNNLITSNNNNNNRYILNQPHPNYSYNEETASAKKTALYDSSAPFDPDVNPGSVRYMSSQQNLISQLPHIMPEPQEFVDNVKDGENSVTNTNNLTTQQQQQQQQQQQRVNISTQQQQQPSNEELVLYGGVETSKITNTVGPPVGW